MNKTIISAMILLGALTLLMTSCAIQSPTNPTTDDSATTTEPVITDDPDESKIEIDYDEYIPTMNTYEEYEAFIKQVKLPRIFLPYEAFSDFGDFDSFVYHGAKYEYLYSVSDAECGRLICITVYPHPMTETFSFSESEQQNMLQFDCKGWGYLKIDHVYYQYYDSSLKRIYVDGGDYYYSINVMGKFDTALVGKDSSLSRLLTRSTAEAVAKEIKASVEKALG